ncbi:MAG: polyphenol oxidase family protein [Kocuria sp.]|nr:polyphenol oxidase family protein [Kocuria sp.]
MYWYRTLVGSAQIVFTNRAAGNLALHVHDDEQAVLRRRIAVEKDVGVAPGSTLYLNQVHGATVVDADAVAPDVVPTADASVSVTGRALAVMVADCVPVVMVGTDSSDPSRHITAVAHAGRQGLMGGVLDATVEVMRARGAGVIQAVIGPSVCGNCYEVPADMARECEDARPGVRSTTSWGTPGLDLPGAAAQCLTDMGVQVQRPQVAGSPACTMENTDLSSHRRAPHSGRIIGMVAVRQQ